MYGDKILDHFLNPRHVGAMEGPDGVGVLGDPVCGDFIKVYIKVQGEKISAISFQIQGCPAAVACGSAMTELAYNKSLNEAIEISDNDIIDHLEGLPEWKEHCSNLGAGALHKAIQDYYMRCLEKQANQD